MRTFQEFILIAEGMTLKDFKANRRKLKRKEDSTDAEKRGHVGKEWYNSGRKYSPDEAKRSRANMDDEERRTRHRSAVDPDNEDDNNYSADKTKNPKKLRKQKAMGELGEENVKESGDWWHPDPKKDAAISGAANKMRARENRGQDTSAQTKPDYSNRLKPGETYMQYAKRKGGTSVTKTKPVAKPSLKDRIKSKLGGAIDKVAGIK